LIGIRLKELAIVNSMFKLRLGLQRTSRFYEKGCN